ncbi:cell death abnormality protein 1-like isoform X2 [Haliotis rufescens]|uniref:cell death abnormality protein 1-like isoform X2 n=1 Tax=Haliotis rufescens TaxID=6454 RepID=UPI00201E8CFE|nr:cell death abnormality protein 1-like isoform X2 [Haliotis rufescens]
MRVKSALAKNCDAMAHHALLVIVVGLSTVSYIAGSCLNCFNTCNEVGLCDDYGCQAGYHGDNCSLPCPTNCRNGVFKKPACSRNTSSCFSGCRGGFFSEPCDQQCPSTCVNKVCNQMDGYCRLGCKEHWHGPDCTAKCNTTCYNSTCDRNGLCQSCETGYWGLFCENNCGQHCLNNTCAMSQDGSFECSIGCQKGWKGAGCEEPSLEEMAHSDTRRKRDLSDCDVKEVDGKCPCCRRNTGKRCEINCPKCRGIYIDSKCNRFCEQGYYNGPNGQCNKTCGDNCGTGTVNKTYCDPTDGGCHSCRHGYRGPKCEYTCSDHCQSKICYINSGYCFLCSNVTFGNHCKDCSEFCLDKFCHRWNGTCMTGCTLGKYGVMCSHDCPTNCYKSHCSISIHGNVLCTGCKDGFTGSSCEERCLVNCTTCHQADGECIVEKPGPEQAVTPPATASPETQTGVSISLPQNVTQATGTEAGDSGAWKTELAVGIVAAIVIVIVIAAVLIWKRKHLPCISSEAVTPPANASPETEPGVSIILPQIVTRATGTQAGDSEVNSASATQEDASARHLESEDEPLLPQTEDSGDTATSSSHRGVIAEDISGNSASERQQDASTRHLEPEVVPLMPKKEDSGDPATLSSHHGVRAENISGLPDDTLENISSMLMGYDQDTRVNFFSNIGYDAENVPKDCTEEVCLGLLKNSLPLKTASEMDALLKVVHASQLAKMDDIFVYILNMNKGNTSIPKEYIEKFRKLQVEEKERERSVCNEK